MGFDPDLVPGALDVFVNNEKKLREAFGIKEKKKSLQDYYESVNDQYYFNLVCFVLILKCIFVF